MAFGFKRKPEPAAPAPSTLDQCAADYANAKADRAAADGSDTNARAGGSEAATSRTEQPKREWRS